MISPVLKCRKLSSPSQRPVLITSGISFAMGSSPLIGSHEIENGKPLHFLQCRKAPVGRSPPC